MLDVMIFSPVSMILSYLSDKLDDFIVSLTLIARDQRLSIKNFHIHFFER